MDFAVKNLVKARKCKENPSAISWAQAHQEYRQLFEARAEQ